MRFFVHKRPHVDYFLFIPGQYRQASCALLCTQTATCRLFFRSCKYSSPMDFFCQFGANRIPYLCLTYWSCLSVWTVCGFDCDRKSCHHITWLVFPLSRDQRNEVSEQCIPFILSSAISVITISCIKLGRLLTSKWYWRKSFLSSISRVASSWIHTYTSCDDATPWHQAAFAYAENRSNAVQNENIWWKWSVGKK